MSPNTSERKLISTQRGWSPFKLGCLFDAETYWDFYSWPKIANASKCHLLYIHTNVRPVETDVVCSPSKICVWNVSLAQNTVFVGCMSVCIYNFWIRMWIDVICICDQYVLDLVCSCHRLCSDLVCTKNVSSINRVQFIFQKQNDGREKVQFKLQLVSLKTHFWTVSF